MEPLDLRALLARTELTALMVLPEHKVLRARPGLLARLVQLAPRDHKVSQVPTELLERTVMTARPVRLAPRELKVLQVQTEPREPTATMAQSERLGSKALLERTELME